MLSSRETDLVAIEIVKHEVTWLKNVMMIHSYWYCLLKKVQKIDKPFNKSMAVLLLVSNLWAQVTNRKKELTLWYKKAINSVLIDLGTSSWLISYSWALVRSWLGPKKDQSVGKKLVGAKPNSVIRAPILRSANISKPYLTIICVSKYFSYLDQKVVRANLN